MERLGGAIMSKDSEREQRLAEALRANLRKRKAQGRARTSEQPEGEGQGNRDRDDQA
jgi:hypothetical protein